MSIECRYTQSSRSRGAQYINDSYIDNLSYLGRQFRPNINQIMPIIVKSKMDILLRFIHKPIWILKLPRKINQGPPVRPCFHVIVRSPQRQRISDAGLRIRVMDQDNPPSAETVQPKLCAGVRDIGRHRC